MLPPLSLEKMVRFLFLRFNPLAFFLLSLSLPLSLSLSLPLLLHLTHVPAPDSTHVTMITFNNGGKWSRLHPPTSSGCHGNSECSLHLHLHYSLLVASEYNRSYSAPLLSTETAVGIIIGHGSYGEMCCTSDHLMGSETLYHLPHCGGHLSDNLPLTTLRRAPL